MAYDLLGKNFVPPDVHGKVTGKAKYAEDFRAEGMVFCKLLLSPDAACARPQHRHGRGARAARRARDSHGRRRAGVAGARRADPDATSRCGSASRSSRSRPTTETIAQDAIDLIKIDFEELPFTVDPLAEPVPGGPDARTDGNVVDNRLIGPPQLKQVKWTAGDFARDERRPAADGRAARRVVVRRRRSGVRESRARARRDVRDGRHVASLDGAALGDVVLGERQVLRLRLDAEPELRRAGLGRLCSASRRTSSSTSRRPAAAASARRAPSIPSWRSRRTCRRRSAGP